ncbi:MAG TPA: PQQ-dependent sugar dehydrogenase [Solirubrobacterales bacterium]|nr:PQQ-dependent sugar dehydrogenase [Solirubrobacterales bacterium]
MIWKLAAGVLLCLLATASAAQALSVRQVGNFDEPIYLTSDPGNPERLFVVERGGAVVLLEAGGLRTFADISSKVSTVGEGGLLSIALAPDFDSSGRFYLGYTDAEGNIHVGEMVASGTSAPLSTLRDVIAPIPHPEDSNHYGGQLQFGPDGALYVSTGDGGDANDSHENAQDPTRLLGKILRITPAPGQLSTPVVWSLGLRNPFRFSFDRSTGAMLIGDVGQGAREEVDYASSAAAAQGANYGWNCMEGTLPGPATDPQCLTNPGPFVPPIFEYPHADPGTGAAHGCAIIGGYVARGPGMGDLSGRYLYGDLCEGDIRSFSLSSPQTSDRDEGLHIGELNSFGQDSCGRLYAISGGGPVFRLIGPESDSCTPAPPPPVLSASYVGIRAISRKVQRHRRGLITAWVTPCAGRRGDPVTLWRGRRQLGTRHLDRVCSVRFRPRIDRRSTFRATVKQDDLFLPAISRKVSIKPVRHLRRRCVTARCQ